MKRPAVIALLVAILCSTVFLAYGGKDFKWEPIPESDWSVPEDPAKGIDDAVVIFERVTVDDTEWIADRCDYTLHRRLRILSAEGREWGDVTIPYVMKDQKIEDIRGRTVLRDGSELYLDESQVFETEIFRGKGIKIKQKAFSLPGVSDDCIVEFYVKYRLKDSPNKWVIQKDIYMMDAEYVWKFYTGGVLSNRQFTAIADRIAPNYIALNTGGQLKSEQRPSIKDPKELVFTVHDVSAFKPEPHSLPDDALRWVVHHYYGQSGAPAAFWGDLDAVVKDGFDKFTKKNKRAREVVAGFETLDSRDAKVEAAYRWLQDNIVNTLYFEGDKDFKDNEHVDHVMEHRYGTPSDINHTFCDMLREMNIDAKMAFTIDRDDNFFLYEAKYWQFDRSMVAVPDESGDYRFYNPGDIYSAPGAVAWFNEATPVLVAGDMNRQFSNIEASDATANRISRHQMLRIDENLEIAGEVVEKSEGHPTRELRRALRTATDEEVAEYLKKRFSACFPSAEADSFDVKGLEKPGEPVTIKCKIKVPVAGQKMGDRVLIRPFDLFSSQENPFEAKERKFPIMFEYAMVKVEAVALDLGENWTVEASPSDTVFSNPAGECHVDFETYGTTLSIQRMLRLNKPLWKVSEYPEVRALFQTQLAFQEMVVVLGERKPTPEQ